MKLQICIILVVIMMWEHRISAFRLDNTDENNGSGKDMDFSMNEHTDQDKNDHNKDVISSNHEHVQHSICQTPVNGKYYTGKFGDEINDIKTAEDCQKLCKLEKSCVAWSYEPPKLTCWTQTTVVQTMSDSKYVSGTCFAPRVKGQCDEQLEGKFYGGEHGPKISDIATVADCMELCNNNSTCLAWSYSTSKLACWLQTTKLDLSDDASYMGGSCLVPVAKRTLEEFRQEALARHNMHRAKHCVSPLTLDEDLNKLAQDYAEKLASGLATGHNTNRGEGIGENMWSGGAAADTHGSVPVSSWYSEIKNYNWANPQNSKGVIGHFTQVVWKDSKKFGIGFAVSSDNTGYVVANYSPAGNNPSRRKENVKPLC